MNSLNVIQEPQLKSVNGKIKQILAIAAGKGGVGKSTVTVNLALALKNQGFKVGILDADIYGPSLQQMLPEGMEPVEDPENPERLLPGLAFGMPLISVAHFKKDASIIRAPIANQIIDQFLHVVEWGELDYLLIDFPPGTGDIQISLMQKAMISGAILVTTPQIVSTIDVRKAAQLFRKMEIPLVGVVENMKYFLDPKTGEKYTPFGTGGGEELAKEFSMPVLGEIPIDPKISEMGDRGESLFEKAKECEGAAAFRLIANHMLIESANLPSQSLEARQVDECHIEIFIDNQWKKFHLHYLQYHCPCARCEKEKKCSKKVSLLEFSPVGRYALKITFSSGCSQGIYPLSLLRQLKT